MEGNKEFDVDLSINDRKKLHGDFEGFAPTYQQITSIIRKHTNYQSLDSAQAVAIDMILNKICRAINGDPYHQDHWKDIIGYAKLGGRL